MMGCNSSDSNCTDSARHDHEVDVPEFKIDATEVTVGQYRLCVEDNSNCSEPLTYSSYCNWNFSVREDHPVTCVSWYQAREYCAWSGKRLCSESEWEKASRGTDGRIYPWGNEEATCDRAVMNEGIEGCGENRTWPVGSKPSGVYGLYDMSGNVLEWVEDDWHDNYSNGPDDGNAWVENPRASSRVKRSGSCYYGAVDLHSYYRDFGDPGVSNYYLGVRCCRSVP